MDKQQAADSFIKNECGDIFDLKRGFLKGWEACEAQSPDAVAFTEWIIDNGHSPCEDNSGRWVNIKGKIIANTTAELYKLFNPGVAPQPANGLCIKVAATIKPTKQGTYYTNIGEVVWNEQKEQWMNFKASRQVKWWLDETIALAAPQAAGPVWVKEIDKARFWSKVKDMGYCWEWQAGKDNCGYGQYKAAGEYIKASRFAYQIINGPLVDGLQVLHKCDNPGCVNPDHLFTGTHQDNMNDKLRKGRGKVLGRASKFHGVAFRKDSNNWRAQVWDGRKHIALGSYPTQEAAAVRRDEEVVKLRLAQPLNFIDGTINPALVEIAAPQVFTREQVEAAYREGCAYAVNDDNAKSLTEYMNANYPEKT